MRDDLLRLLREFTGAILNPYDPGELLHRLTSHSMELLDASGAGIMLENQDGELSFAAASDDQVLAIELHQERVREGVCFEAYRQNRMLGVEDVTELSRQWPAYAERVQHAGLRSVLGTPMNAYGRTIGVINIYRQGDAPWSPADIEAAEVIASVGAGYIVHASEMQAQHDLTEQLQAAIDTRDVIGQAKGIIMHREAVTDREAFEILRTTSQQSNRKLRDVARLVIDDTIDVATDRRRR